MLIGCLWLALALVAGFVFWPLFFAVLAAWIVTAVAAGRRAQPAPPWRAGPAPRGPHPRDGRPILGQLPDALADRGLALVLLACIAAAVLYEAATRYW